jgi:NADH:ubiquinone oxidoreductase subunit C
VNIAQILKAIQAVCPSEQVESYAVPIDEHFVALPSSRVRPAVQILLDQAGVTHLSTITGQDVDGRIELLYHFWDGHGLTLRTSLPREIARIATLIDLIPGAAYYEREIAEMLHVTFEGHPNPRALLLPDDWNGDPPLRKASAPDPDKEHPP